MAIGAKRTGAPLTLFSTVTSLAYLIGERFYRQRHYVWCAPAPPTDAHVSKNPPSSDPIGIYWTYHRDIAGGDRHSAAIEANRNGIIRGARNWCDRKVISEADCQLIEAIVRGAPLTEFRPLLLVIPWRSVQNKIAPVDPDRRARTTSEEYIIEFLPRRCFDILELHR